MTWPFRRKKEERDDPEDRMDWIPTISPPNRQDPAAQGWTTYQVTWTVAGTVIVLYGTRTAYKRYLRRIPNVDHIKPNVYRKRSLYGYVTKVGDGDNFRFHHTPGGWLAGWGWIRRPQNLTRDDLTNNTLHVRIAGVDAPECSHFGRPAQPFGPEAMAWLGNELEGRYVRVWPFSRDRFDRIVSAVEARPAWHLRRTDLGLRMIQHGIAGVYEAKTGSEFGGREEQYRAAEQQAKSKKIGMWEQPGLVGKMMGKTSKFESPREYKNRMRNDDMAK